MLHQAASLEVMPIRHRNNIEISMWKNRWYFINFESQIDVELNTWNWCHLFDVDLPSITDETSTNFQRGVSMSNRWRIDEDVSIGLLLRPLLWNIQNRNVSKLRYYKWQILQIITVFLFSRPMYGANLANTFSFLLVF